MEELFLFFSLFIFIDIKVNSLVTITTIRTYYVWVLVPSSVHQVLLSFFPSSLTWNVLRMGTFVSYNPIEASYYFVELFSLPQ